MVYRTTRKGRFLACERWPICDVTHSVHPDGTPMGTPAARHVREARIEAHNVFDAFWKGRGWTRREGYLWLQRAMGLPKDLAHIAHFNFNQCQALIAVIRDELEANPLPTEDEIIERYKAG